MEEKAKINEWDYIKLKCSWLAKETATKTKEATKQMGGRICKQKLWQRIIPKIYKELMHLNTKQTIQFKTEQKIWTDTSPKKTYKWPIDIWKDAWPHQLLEKCKSKLQWDSASLLPVRIPIIKRQVITTIGEVSEKKEPSFTAGWESKQYSHYGK